MCAYYNSENVYKYLLSFSGELIKIAFLETIIYIYLSDCFTTFFDLISVQNYNFILFVNTWKAVNVRTGFSQFSGITSRK